MRILAILLNTSDQSSHLDEFNHLGLFLPAPKLTCQLLSFPAEASGIGEAAAHAASNSVPSLSDKEAILSKGSSVKRR